MKEAQTQEEVSTFSEHFVAGNVVPSFPASKLDVLWVNADCSPVEPVLSQVIALISKTEEDRIYPQIIDTSYKVCNVVSHVRSLMVSL